MKNASSFSAIAPLVFDGENYQAMAVKMQDYLEFCNLWKVVDEDYEVLTLPGSPTMAQIETHKERKTKSKIKSYLFIAVSATIFSRKMTYNSAKEI